MNLRQVIGRAFGLAASADDGGGQGRYADGWVALGGESTAGVRVTPDIALKAAALYACVKILAETIATLPLRMRRTVAGGAVDAPDHPLDELLRYQPNAVNTAVEFWEMMILHAGLRGTAYAEIVPGARGAVDQLLPLHTDRVSPERLRDGSYRFRVSNPHTGATRILLQEEVFRVPGMSSDGISGLRAVDLAADDLGLGMAADEYAARVFSNKLNLGGFLVHPKKISPEAQRNLVQALMERFAGARNSHRPMVLQEGMDWKKASMDASEAQLLEARKWQIILIAMRWRIPLHMLGIYDGATHSNVEQQALDLVKYTLRPWVKRIEQAIRRDLIVARGVYWAEFNLEGLLRGDAQARAEYFKAALGSGGHAPWMTVNEVRRIEGLNDIDGGDVIRWPANRQDGNPAAPARAEIVGEVNHPTISAEDGRDEALGALARAERLIGKENAAIRRAARRFADDPAAFRTWAAAFYGGHVSTVMEILGVPRQAARAYCEHGRDELLAAPDVARLLAHREDEAPRGIAGAIENHAKDQP